MANKIYYGVSTTASATATKQVKLVDASFNVSSLQKGDILSVYFAHKNTATNVSLALYINDVQQETNISNANGNLVYNTGRIQVKSGAWTDGEVVNFSYTHNGTITENPDNVYYWEMIGKPVATGTTYGDVTLDGNDDSAASVGKVKELLSARTGATLSYDNLVSNGTPIGNLHLQTSDAEGEPITNTINLFTTTPVIPTKTSDLTNDSGFLTNPLQITVSGQPKTIINLHDGNQNTVINSVGGGILLQPASGQQVVVGDSSKRRSLVVNGNITASAGIITASKTDLSNTLLTDKIGAHTSGGTITFTSPVNITNGTVSSLKTNGITIGSQTLPNYIKSFLNTDDAKNILNSWLAGKLNGYLYTRRYHCGPFKQIDVDKPLMVYLGGGEKYWYTDDNGSKVSNVTKNLNISGYDIVGIIAWETYQLGNAANPQNSNICSICWYNNDPSTGRVDLRLAAVTKKIISVGISVDILYKKKLQ